MAEQGNEQPALEDEVEDMEDEEVVEAAVGLPVKQMALTLGRLRDRLKAATGGAVGMDAVVHGQRLLLLPRPVASVQWQCRSESALPDAVPALGGRNEEGRVPKLTTAHGAHHGDGHVAVHDTRKVGFFCFLKPPCHSTYSCC